MIDYKIVMIISAVIGSYLLLAYLDSKYKVSFLAWLNGEASSPFSDQPKSANIQKFASYDQASLFTTAVCDDDSAITSKKLIDENNELKEEVECLRERVQVLEKIVTEPAYELNQKIKQL